MLCWKRSIALVTVKQVTVTSVRPCYGRVSSRKKFRGGRGRYGIFLLINIHELIKIEDELDTIIDYSMFKFSAEHIGREASPPPPFWMKPCMEPQI